MGLNPVGAADDQHRAVQHRHSPLRLRGEIHMARGVNEDDLPAGRLQNGLLGKNRNAPGPLQLMGVQKRVLMVHPPQSPPGPAAVEQRLRQRRLPRVHMG